MTLHKKLGEQAEKHHVVPNYESWGLVGNLQVSPAGDDAVRKGVALLKSCGFDADQFSLSAVNFAEYYQGDELMPRKAVLVRFNLTDEAEKVVLGGQHVSVVFDYETGELLGLTRMLRELDDKEFVTHQEALNVALEFVKKVAPDLIDNYPADITLNTLPSGSRMVFPDPIILEHVQINWIDRHDEFILVGEDKITLSGMKVKMYLHELNLWTWMIVDKHGQVQTFERSISWDFDKMQRKTQLWLHDEWLKTHGINL